MRRRQWGVETPGPAHCRLRRGHAPGTVSGPGFLLLRGTEWLRRASTRRTRERALEKKMRKPVTGRSWSQPPGPVPGAGLDPPGPQPPAHPSVGLPGRRLQTRSLGVCLYITVAEIHTERRSETMDHMK